MLTSIVRTLAFILCLSSSVFLLPKRSVAGFIYGGIDADIAFAVRNDNYSNNSAYSQIAPFFGDMLMLGLGIRFGYENVIIDHLYFSGEIYTRFMFPATSASSMPQSVNAYASVGLAGKIGFAFGNQKSRLYAIAAAEYMSAILPSGSDISRIGSILVGGGLGFKRELYYFVDVFIESKVMFDVFTHINHFSTSTTPDLQHSGSLGYQLLNVAIGVELKI